MREILTEYLLNVLCGKLRWRPGIVLSLGEACATDANFDLFESWLDAVSEEESPRPRHAWFDHCVPRIVETGHISNQNDLERLSQKIFKE